jgi:hypothetical protein
VINSDPIPASAKHHTGFMRLCPKALYTRHKHAAPRIAIGHLFRPLGALGDRL